MASDLEIIQQFDTHYNDAYQAWSPFFPAADRDLRFYLGDQWDQSEKRHLFSEGRNAFVFNKVRRAINMVTGYQRKNRLSSVSVPIENADQETADQLTQLLLYILQSGDGYQCISDCFGGALKTGLNLLSLWVDYRDDPISGDIRFGREPYNGFMLDPYFTKLDFSDCGYILRRKYLSPEHVASLLPKERKDIYDLARIGWSRDDKFTWLPYQRQPNGQDMMAFSEMYVQKWKQVPAVVDMESGEIVEIDKSASAIKEFVDQYEELELVMRPKRYIERSIIVNDVLIRTDINPNGLDEYPFVPFTAIFEPESDQWELKTQSLIRCMIDPQREANRRRSQMVDLLDSQINSGWIADRDSVINPQSLFQSSQGKVIWRKEGSAPGAIEKIPPAQIPPSFFQLQEMFDRDLVDIVGINDAAFGQTENAQESGVMMMLRQGAAIVNLQDLFDKLRNAQKHVSQKAVKLMQQWSPEKMQRILGEEPSQMLKDKDLTKYDVAIQEGILTDTQKQMYFRQLIDLKQLGAPVTGEMLAEAAPIQGKSKYVKQIAQMEQQQAQQQQKQEQLIQAQLDSKRQSDQAKAVSDITLSKERFTRAIANMGLEDERASKSIQDRSDAALTRVKAIKELQSIDDDRLLKYLSIVRMMEENNRMKEQQVKSDDVQISEAANRPSQDTPQVGGLLGELPTQPQPQGGVL